MRRAVRYAAGMNHRRTVPLAVLTAALFVPAVGCDPAPEADGGLTAAGRSVILRDLRGAFPLAEIVRDFDPADGRAPAIAAALASAREVAAHRLRGADGNTVYLHPDGHREAVYDAAGDLVRDGDQRRVVQLFPPVRRPAAALHVRPAAVAGVRPLARRPDRGGRAGRRVRRGPRGRGRSSVRAGRTRPPGRTSASTGPAKRSPCWPPPPTAAACRTFSPRRRRRSGRPGSPPDCARSLTHHNPKRQRGTGRKAPARQAPARRRFPSDGQRTGGVRRVPH